MNKDTRLVSDDAISSSPSPAIFSDEAARTSSPSSSPPGFPWEQQHTSNENDKLRPAQNNAFSILGKRKAFDSLSENARPSKKPASSKPAPKALSQMQISLGQTVQKRCKVCGMEYVPSALEDRKLHEKYHKQNVEGYDIGKDFVRKTSENAILLGARKEDAICAVDCHDTAARKRRAQAVLDIVQRELGAVEIPEDELWMPLKTLDKNTGAKFKAYLYIRDTKCVGLLLAQRIEKAFRVVEPSSAPESGGQRTPAQEKTAAGKLKARQQALVERLKQPLQLSREQFPARLGVSRIWTSSTHRRANIATSLLQAALDHSCRSLAASKTPRTDLARHKNAETDVDVSVVYSGPALTAPVTREEVAFSQPTEAGTRLARRWFDRNYGWLVYID